MTAPAWKKRKIETERVRRMTKEEFMIEWVFLRASFREDFSGTAAARAAEEVWNEIQKRK
jgi:hypothetical protein